MEFGFGNKTLLCQDLHAYSQYKNIWQSGNPLDPPISLLFIQVSLITLVTQFLDACLRPLGQTSLVSQILGGMVFGPSALGHKKLLENTLFPAKGSVSLQTMATFGLLFFYFICCVKMDTAILLRIEKQALAIGLSVFSFTLLIPMGLAFLLKKYVSMDKSLSDALLVIAFSQSFTVFISISVLLAELKIQNTDIGRLAISSAMFADCIGFGAIVIMYAVMQSSGNMLTLAWILLTIAALLVIIIFVMRPAIIRMLECSTGKPVDEFCIVCIFLFVLLTGFVSEFIGQHYPMGPIVLGLAVPEGPPLGATLITKLETLSMGFLYPIYLAVSGLQTDIFRINIQSMWIVTIIVVVGFFVKIGAVMLPGYFYNIPMKDCCVIGLLLNGRGVSEVTVYNIWMGDKLLTSQEFSLLVVSLVVVNAILAPMIKILHDPSEQYHHSGRRCSIQHNKQDSELRVMICIYNNENIPTMLNIVEASYASRESSVVVIALVLVELLGRSRPILVAHQPHDTLRSTKCDSTQLDNGLKQYAQLNEGHASVQSFTSMSDLNTIHDDVCRISLDRGANIVIVPFHKRWEIDGTVEVTNRAIQTMNIKVLEKAPCSVGILIDRGILNGSPSFLISRATYDVVVLFIGGADDAEALAYASRMARHECVNVTVVRFLLFGEENSKDRKRDSDLVDEYRYYNAGNCRFEIIDEVVKDGIEMSSCIRKRIDCYDLVMVGREHPQSVLLHGHDQWSECPELGVIGDIVASQDYVTKASVLVVQQQRIRGRFLKHTVNNPMPNQRDQLVNDVPVDEPSRASCIISVDKC